MDKLGLGVWVHIASIRSCVVIHGDFGDFGGPFLLRLLLGLGPLASSWSRHGDLNVKLGAMSGVTESCYGIPRYLSSLQRLSPEMVDAVQ